MPALQSLAKLLTFRARTPSLQLFLKLCQSTEILEAKFCAFCRDIQDLMFSSRRWSTQHPEFFNINYLKVIFTFIADYHILIPHLIAFKLTFWAYILTQINNKKWRKSYLTKNSSHPLKLIYSLQITIALHLLFRLGFSFQHRMWKLRCIPLSISVVLPAPSINCSLLIFRRRNNCCSHFLQNQVSFEKYCHSATPWASGLTHKEQWEPWRQTSFFSSFLLHFLLFHFQWQGQKEAAAQGALQDIHVYGTYSVTLQFSSDLTLPSTPAKQKLHWWHFS